MTRLYLIFVMLLNCMVNGLHIWCAAKQFAKKRWFCFGVSISYVFTNMVLVTVAIIVYFGGFA